MGIKTKEGLAMPTKLVLSPIQYTNTPIQVKISYLGKMFPKEKIACAFGDSPVSTPESTPVLTLDSTLVLTRTLVFEAVGQHRTPTPGVESTLVLKPGLTPGVNTLHGVLGSG